MSQRKTALKQELQEARDALLAAIEGCGEADWTKPTVIEGWTVRDQLAHLAYNQPSQPRLVRNILEGKGGTPDNFDLDYFNRRGLEKQQGKSVAELRALLEQGHAETLRVLDEMDEADLDKQGRHASAGQTTLENIFRTIARHDREHTGYIREALKRA